MAGFALQGPGRRALRAALVLAVVASLVTGLSGGLLRVGALSPAGLPSAWAGAAVSGHAFLMICAFLGTVIGIERAVAARHALAFTGPVLSAAAGVATVGGVPAVAAWLAVGASAAFVAVNFMLLWRQAAAHTLLLLVAAAGWFVGCVLHAVGADTGAVDHWWFLFLVLTIAAERLEMSRLMRRRPGATAALYAIVALLFVGAAAAPVSIVGGGTAYGVALVLLAAWLARFDIARRTVRAGGLSRYMAVCMLAGYAWLAVGGVAWTATAQGHVWLDAALHALALGFVFSMVLGHAPVILPAVARVKLAFGPAWYLPLGLLHASLALRLLGGFDDFTLRRVGAAGNALALAVFAATVAGSILAWRLRHAPTRPGPRHETAAPH